MFGNYVGQFQIIHESKEESKGKLESILNWILMKKNPT